MIKVEHQITFLKDAINKIDSSYFNLKTTYSSIIRERVFCYELYHQIRNIVGEKDNLFRIHGEPDKRGHLKFDVEDRRNPDFIFHAPSSMNHNLIVLEVKGKYSTRDVCKDLDTLNIFTTKYNYKKGVFLIYNYSLEHFRRNIKRQKQKFQKFSTNSNIIILCKKSAFDLLEESTLIEILS